MIFPTLQLSLAGLVVFAASAHGAAIARRQAGECAFLWSAVAGDTCKSLAADWDITEAQFKSYNPEVSCPTLNPGQWYCLERTGEVPPTSGPTSTMAPTTTAKPMTTAPTTTAKPMTTTTTTTAPANGITTPTPVQEGMVTNCNKFATVRPTTTCQGILDWNKISLADFVKWNPAVGADCSNLWANTYACIGVIGGPPPSTTTTLPPSNGITTPTPNQKGMATNCNAFATVRPTTTCQGILDWNKISLIDFVKWNPDVKSDCTNLQANTYACIGVIGGSTTQPGNGINTPTPIQQGMVTNCNAFATVRPTTTCQGILDWNKISLTDFVKWNPAVGKDCTNLWSNTYACIGVIGGGTSTGGGGGSAVETPSPIQSGMVKGCTKFHPVKPTTTCQGILDYHKISLTNFVKWNPAVGKDCTNLWANTYACVQGP